MIDCDVILLFALQGMSMPIAHVEESWQMAEFYNNKVIANLQTIYMISYLPYVV